ncbi:MAG: tRNA pseudouridine(55) synthase TruB [Acidaminococcaceae bacterium]
MVDGILNVLKPSGMTSHDVIGYLRRVLQTKKIGHSGTLDPDAAGVLPVFIGTATRLLEYSGEETKSYRVELRFGAKTDTADDSGNIVETSVVFKPDKEQIKTVLQKFTGSLMQLPPMYSAVRHDGKKLYQLARAGLTVERESRPITIYKLSLVYQSDDYLLLDVECSKGTFIRTLCEDIAEAFGMCGTVSFLLRTRSGRFDLDDAKTLEEISKEPFAHLLPIEVAVEHFPELILTDKQALRISQGVITSILGVSEGKYRLKTVGGFFIGIGTACNGMVKADKVINPFTQML